MLDASPWLDETEEPHKYIYLNVNGDVHAVSGSWHLQPAGEQWVNGQFYLSFNNLVMIDDVNYVIHPEDICAAKDTISKLLDNHSVVFVLRIISEKLDIQSLSGIGHLVKTNKKSSPKLDTFSDDIANRITSEQGLQESEERFRSLIDSFAQAVWETDADGAVVKDSPSWREYTGQTIEEWLGYGWVNAVHAEDRASAEKQWSDAIKSGKNLDAEFRVKHASEGYRWTNVRAIAIPGTDGNILKWYGMNIDIHHRKQAEELLKELNTQLREMDKTKTDFFNNVSHEFRTPLALMIGPLDELVKSVSAKMQPNEIQKLSMAYRNAIKLQKLVNNLLDFARIQAGKLEVFYQPTDIGKLTVDLASNFRSAVEKANLKYIIKIEHIQEPVYLNREMWEKIVLNLLSNAFKFTISGKIEVLIRNKKKKVELHVRDTGIGIPTANKDRIFERFNRLERTQARSQEGTGIGLALIKELVVAHGGNIKVKSEEGKGSTFIVAIPKGKSHIPRRQIFETKEDFATTSSRNSYVQEALGWLPEEISNDKKGSLKARQREHLPHIVVADDNADMREYLTTILSDNYKITAVEHGQKVLDLLDQGSKPDLILADVMMPQLDGFTMVERIKSNPAYSHIPVVLVSAKTSEESRIEGLKVGADDYVVKPFSAKELRALVNSRVQSSFTRLNKQSNLTKHNQELQVQMTEATHELEENRAIVDRHNEHLQKILDAIPQMVWVLDSDYRIKFINERWSTYTGISIEQCMNKKAPTFDLFHPALARDVREKWSFLELQQIRYVGEFLVKNHNGEYRWHLDITEAILDQNGNVEMWLGTFTDVHEQFMTEKAIQETRDLLQAVFNASASSIAVFEAVRDDETDEITDFVCTYFNLKSLALYGVQDMKGKSLTTLLARYDVYKMLKELKAVVASGVSKEFDYPINVTNGTLWYHLVATKLRDGFVLTQTNITDRIEARERLQELNESLKHKNHELKEMNQELTNFAFIGSHDLREPLRKIQFYTSQLGTIPLSEGGQKYVEKIISSVHRMNELIADVLSYSKTSSGPRKKLIPTNLDGILDKVLEDMSDIIERKAVTIERINALPIFSCNAVQISQLFQNLISNAIKFQDGSRTPTVKIESEIVPGESIASPLVNKWLTYLKLEITDNGIGFEQEYSDKIFGLFKKLHSHEEYPGTGMGLAICKKVVENHKGVIVASSTPGVGSVFTCYLPVSE